MGALPRRPEPVRLEVAEAAADLEAVLARVAAGEEIVLSRDGVPVARLVAETVDAAPLGEAIEQFRALRAEAEPEAGNLIDRMKARARGLRLGEPVRALRDAGRA